MEDEKALGQYTKIVVETDEEKPVTIAVIGIFISSNFIRLTDDPPPPIFQYQSKVLQIIV